MADGLRKKKKKQGHPARPSSHRVVIQPPGNLVKECDREGMTDNSELQHYQAASVMNPGALLPLNLLEVAFFQVIEVNQAKSTLTNTG